MFKIGAKKIPKLIQEGNKILFSLDEGFNFNTFPDNCTLQEENSKKNFPDDKDLEWDDL